MAIHPPSLYTGFVGMTIPFAFGIAALVTGHLDDSWLRAVRRWTMFSWLFLSFGLTLGMIWAYEELGWGGYWAWDPVENAALLPWFTATAFLHSVMVQERRSMLRVWNVTLVIVTFFLTIFGTFMTRSGVVQSVHAFGDDPILARLFIGFMVVIWPSASAADLAAAAAEGAQRARLLAVARGGVPGEQLGHAVRRALRAVRHDVPDAERSGHRQPADRSPARSSTNG
jgi:cytochrome c-type biogenesis protein CcmF